MGKQMSVRELRAALSRIEHELAEHGEIELTRNGDAIAVVTQKPDKPKAFAGRRELREQLPEWPAGTIKELLGDARGRY